MEICGAYSSFTCNYKYAKICAMIQEQRPADKTLPQQDDEKKPADSEREVVMFSMHLARMNELVVELANLSPSTPTQDLNRYVGELSRSLLVANSRLDLLGKYPGNEAMVQEVKTRLAILETKLTLEKIQEALKERDKKPLKVLRNAALLLALATEILFPGKIRDTVSTTAQIAQVEIDDKLDSIIPGREFEQEVEPHLSQLDADVVPKEAVFENDVRYNEVIDSLNDPKWEQAGDHKVSVQAITVKINEDNSEVYISLVDPKVTLRYKLDEIDGKLVHTRIVSEDESSEGEAQPKIFYKVEKPQYNYDNLIDADMMEALLSAARAEGLDGSGEVSVPVIALTRDDRPNDLALILEGRHVYVNVIFELIKEKFNNHYTDLPLSVQEKFSKLSGLVSDNGENSEEVANATTQLHYKLAQFLEPAETSQIDILLSLLRQQSFVGSDQNDQADQAVWGTPVIGPDGSLLVVH